MDKYLVNHVYIITTVIFATASQLIVKWQMGLHSMEHLDGPQAKYVYAIKLLLNPYIVLSLILTLLSGLSWMIAMSKFDISYAYPYTVLGLVFILAASSLLFNEELTMYKLVGFSLIALGIFVTSRDM